MLNKKFKKIVKELSQGIIVKGSSVRAKTKLLEINVLRLKEKELILLERVLNLEINKNDESLNSVRDLVSNKESLPEGSTELPATTFANLRTISSLIGRTSGAGYDLGQLEISQLVQKMVLVREYYNNVGSKSHVSDDQSNLIDSMIVAAQSIDSISKKDLKQLEAQTGSVDNYTLLQLLTSADGHENYSLDASSSFLGDIKKGKGRIVYEFESSEDNKFKGKLSSVLETQFRSLLLNPNKVKKSAIGKEATRLLQEANPFRVVQSPSIIDRISMELDAAFLETKSKNKPVKKLIKVRRQVKNNRSAAKVLAKSVKNRVKRLKTKLAAVRKKKKFIIPTVTLKALLNSSLSDFIDKNMQSPNSSVSTNYLRFQTGNFSDSARILTLNRQQSGSFIGTYTYDTKRYSTFEPGNKRGSTGRDPKRYIQGAAREIAIQILKKNFKGIALERQ